MKFRHIRTEEREEGIGIITLNRPERRNAISTQMRYEISDCLSHWKQSSSIGAVIFTGANNSFSAGFELSEFNNPDQFSQLFDSSSKYHRDVWHFPKPTIAAINGAAIGGGFDLATLFDVRISSETAIFGHPEVKFGAPPIITPLRWIVGEGIARELCLTGRKIDSQEAYRIGLISEIVDSDKVLNRAIELAKEIIEAPWDALKFSKAYFTGNAGRGFEESFYYEHDKAFQEILLPKARKGFK